MGCVLVHFYLFSLSNDKAFAKTDLLKCATTAAVTFLSPIPRLDYESESLAVKKMFLPTHLPRYDI